MDEPHEQRDFFISYTQTDRAWAEWIAWELEAAGYTTVLQAWDMPPGTAFARVMQQATTTSRHTLLVLSPTYLRSAMTEAEWRPGFVEDPSGEGRRLVPVRIEACQPEGLLADRVYLDLVGLDEVTARAKLLEGVGAALRGHGRPDRPPRFPKAPATAAVDRPRFPTALPPVWNLSFPRNPNFTGRDNLLARLVKHLNGGGSAAAVVHAQAMYGLGGIGKTQLVVEYAYRHQVKYQLIWWISAEQPLAIPGQLTALARRLGLPDAPEQAETIQSLWDEPRRRDRWLLIFDNAEQPADVRPYWPPGGSGHVLVTSRNPAWGGLASPLEVDVLPRQQSIGFLARRIADDQDPNALGALAEMLGDLPLALEQAAAYIEETATPVDQYVSLFAHRAQELFELGRPSNSQDTIATIWTLSLERIRTTSPAAQDLLTVCAVLAPDDIPRDLLSDHAGVLPQPLATVAADPLAWQQTIGALRRYSLITATGQTLSMHRLVQAVVRHGLDPDHAKSWAVAGLTLIEQAFPNRAYEFDHWPTCAQPLPHALAVIKHTDELAADTEATASFLHKIGLYLWGRAEHTQAKPLLERALSIREARLGAEYPDTAWSLNGLGVVLHDQGDLQDARTMLERALTIREARLGPDHPNTANSLSNLANVLADLGRLPAARTFLIRALAIYRRRLGPNHPTTIQCRRHLAALHGGRPRPRGRR